MSREALEREKDVGVRCSTLRSFRVKRERIAVFDQDEQDIKKDFQDYFFYSRHNNYRGLDEITMEIL